MAAKTAPQDKRNDDDKEAAALLRWGKRANSARSAWGWWNWLASGGTGNAVAGFGAMTLVAATAGLVAFDGVKTAWGIPGTLSIQPVTVAERQALGEDAVLYQVSGVDLTGRKATFDLIVMSRDTVWVKGSTEKISRGGAVIEAEAFRRLLANGALGQRVAAARELIAVGVASREGEQTTEEARASQRAHRIGGWLIEIDKSKKPIWALNLGQHRGDCAECDTGITDWQRPIIVVGQATADTGVNLGEALADAMSKRANLPSPESYSRFSILRLR